jgi:peptidoglycan/LPS O-acetylase OafA/YrhL
MGYFRFLLALAVVLHHTPGSPYMFNGGFAVELFFMISGFYMALVLQKKYADKTYEFYTNRLLRLMPTYYLILAANLLAIIFFNAGEHLTRDALVEGVKDGHRSLLIWTNLTVVGQEWASFLSFGPDGFAYFDPAQTGDLPAWKTLLIPQAWSISIELMFYMLAPFIFGARGIKYVWMLLIFSLACRFAVIGLDLPYNSWARRFLPCVLCFFVAGGIVCRARTKHAALIAKLPMWGIVAAIVVFFAALYKFRFPGPREYALVYPLLAVFFAFLLPVAFQRLGSNFEELIGDLSFPMYLIHTLWIGVGEKMMGLEKFSLSAFVVCLTLLSSLLIYYTVDRPLNGLRQRRVALA